MKDITIIYNNCLEIGIRNRKITEGKEKELVYEYLAYRNKEFQASAHNKMMVFIEPQIGNSYPDMIFVEYNPESYHAWNENRNNLNKKDLKILYHIYAMKGIDLEEIVSQLGFTWKEAASGVERLFDSELIVRKSKKWVMSDNVVMNNIQAVEAKIDNWNQVLQQSILNRNFASESYALMDSGRCQKENVISKFVQSGVGVCIREGNTFKTLKRAKSVNTFLSFNSIMINEWIGRILYQGGEMINVNG